MASARRRDGFGDHFPDPVVAEVVSESELAHYPAQPQLVEIRHQVLLRDLACCCQEIEGEPRSHHGRHVGKPPCTGRELGEPLLDDATDRRGENLAAVVAHAGSDALDDKKRVAIGVGVELSQGRRVELACRKALRQLGRCGLVERAECQVDDPLLVTKGGAQRHERFVIGRLLRPHRAGDEQGASPAPRSR